MSFKGFSKQVKDNLLKQFIIFNPEKDDYLSQLTNTPSATFRGWHPHPFNALKFTLSRASKLARQITQDKDIVLIVCKLTDIGEKLIVEEVTTFGAN